MYEKINKWLIENIHNEIAKKEKKKKNEPHQCRNGSALKAGRREACLMHWTGLVDTHCRNCVCTGPHKREHEIYIHYPYGLFNLEKNVFFLFYFLKNPLEIQK